MGPDLNAVSPSLAAYAEAQDRKRALLGSDITFYWDPVIVYPDGTPLSPETGEPYDPTTVPLSSGQSSATVRAGVSYKMQLTTRGSSDSASTPIGRGEKSRVAVILALADAPTVAGASYFEFHEDRYQISSVKRDEIVLGYERVVIYGAILGEGT